MQIQKRTYSKRDINIARVYYVRLRVCNFIEITQIFRSYSEKQNDAAEIASGVSFSIRKKYTTLTDARMEAMILYHSFHPFRDCNTQKFFLFSLF